MKQKYKTCPAEHTFTDRKGSLEKRCFFSDKPCLSHGAPESCQDYRQHIMPNQPYERYQVSGINQVSLEAWRGV